MGRIIGLLGSMLLGGAARLFSGWRLFAGGLMMMILAVILYNLVADIIEELLLWVQTQMGTIEVGSVGTVLNTTGLAAWFVINLKVAECVSFMVSMIIMKWTLRKIPLIKW